MLCDKRVPLFNLVSRHKEAYFRILKKPLYATMLHINTILDSKDTSNLKWCL